MTATLSPFTTLRPRHYGALLVDPPWAWETYSEAGQGKSPQSQYSCMDLAAIRALPMAELVRDDAVLFLWATFPMLPQALSVMGFWGFRYVTGLPWAKQSKSGQGWAFGTGYWVRNAAELLLIGTSGAPGPKTRGRRGLIVSPLREHSRKPDDVYALVEEVAHGPYAELFARQRRPGWDCWGHETDKFGETS